MASPAFSVGGALPDLSRLRGQGFRLKPGHWVVDNEGDPMPSLSPIQQELEAGLLRHHAIDAHWHNSALFAHLQARVRHVLAEMGITVQRPSFLAHIGAEMLLDRALLHQMPDLATRFYACFAPSILAEVYALVALKGHEAWVPKLQIGIEAFVRRRYLQDYAGDYLSRTWPDIYQHITADRSACSYPTSAWLEAVDDITQLMMDEVDFADLKATYAAI
jgi:hypothetical protein